MYIYIYIYNSEDGFVSWNKCDTIALTGRFSSCTMATVNIDSLQHTATHCNTLQHTATHPRYQHCQIDIARNTWQQNSSRSVCAVMKVTSIIMPSQGARINIVMQYASKKYTAAEHSHSQHSKTDVARNT